MKRFFMLKHNKGMYFGGSLSEIFSVMYTLSEYDKHNCSLPEQYSEKGYALHLSIFDELCIEGVDEYKIGSFVIRMFEKECESEVTE